MPTRTKVRPQPKPGRVTNEYLAARLGEIAAGVNQRLDHLEDIIGLNGNGQTLKDFLEQLRASNVNHLAWVGVRADLRRRLRFLAQPRAILKALFYAVLGGIGWKLASGLPSFHLPWQP